MSKTIPILIFVCLFSFLFPLRAEEMVNFKGDLDFLKQAFKLEMDFKEKSQLKTNLNIEDDKFYLNAKVDHLRFNNHDFTTEVVGEGSMIKQDGVTLLKCNIESKYSLLDYEPFKDISSQLTISRDSVIINSFRWGETNIIGDISLVAPYEVDLYAEIKDADINNLAALLGFNQQDFSMSGTVEGFLRIKGPFTSAKINGQLKATDGNIEDLLYNEILVKVDGVYPVIYLFDSEILEEDGIVYSFEGKVNLAELNNFYSKEHNIVFSPLTEENEFSWHKWTIRRDKTRGNLEIENRLKSGRPDKLRLRDDDTFDMLGVEQTLKF